MGGVGFYGKTDIEQQIALLQARENLNVGRGATVMAGKLDDIARDLAYLSSNSVLHDALDKGSAASIGELANAFASFSNSKIIYDQLRWIDETGMERVRVDYVGGKAIVIARDKLQNKGQRYFFTDTVKLNPGEMFVSPLDLNIEQNKIEVPYKPMVRLATPVVDSRGNQRGIVIINYYARGLLDAFDEATSGVRDHVMVLNGDGYWLKSPNPDDEWGFMFNQTERSLATRAPEAWQRIRAEDSGQTLLAGGLWTWQTVYPLKAGLRSSTGTAEAFVPSRGEVEMRQYVWKTVAHLSSDTLDAVSRPVWQRLWSVAAVLLGLLGFGSFKLAQAWSHRDAALAQVRHINANLESTIAKRTHQLQLAASVFTHAREGILITDRNATIVEVNQAFSVITGYSREEVIGQNPRILKSGRQSKEFYTSLWNTLIEKGHWYGELWNRRQDGAVYAELVSMSVVHDANGQVSNYVAVFTDITSMKAHQAQLEHVAHYDALTSLPNRMLLSDRLHQALIQSQRRECSLAVAYLDLDGFKEVNDRHGHQVGDELLIALSARMKDALRESDTLARMGGDEFLAVLGDLEHATDYEPVLSRLLRAASAPIRVGDAILNVSASIGVTLSPRDGIEPDQLIRQADQAMYQAKQSGKNRYHLFDIDSDQLVKMQNSTLDRIRLALARKEFVLYYQPKVVMSTGEVIVAEALIRWNHPEQGILSPAAFLPLVHDHPLGVELGEWVIHAALTQIEAWHATGLDIPVSVNVGARQLQQGDFVARLSETLAAHPDVRPSCLELEILETSALDDLNLSTEVMHACRTLGVRFALDDFGTGYSSLTYLRYLPADVIKIDQTFVRDMLTDQEDQHIVQAVVELARAFGRDVIAEGVETVEHGNALIRLGCIYAQGYAIARPMPGNDLQSWVATWKPDASWLAH